MAGSSLMFFYYLYLTILIYRLYAGHEKQRWQAVSLMFLLFVFNPFDMQVIQVMRYRGGRQSVLCLYSFYLTQLICRSYW